MGYQTSRTSDGPVLNALQVIVLDIVLTVGLLVTFKLSGAGWLFSFVAAWAGGCLLTIVAAFAIYKVAVASEQRSEAVSPRPAPEPAKIVEAIKVWETDRLLDRDLAAQASCEDAADGGTVPVGDTPTADTPTSGLPDHTDMKRASGT